MQQLIIAVRDRQLNAFMRPFTAQTAGQAIRSFRDEINRPDSELNRHPEDYELYRLGTFNEQTGEIKSEDPQQIALASNLIEQNTFTRNVQDNIGRN